MPRNDVTDAVRALCELIQREREAILAGDFATLAHLERPKAELTGRINREGDADIEGLGALRAGIARNQVLLESAMAGIRSVAARLETLRGANEALTVYDVEGRSRRFETALPRSLERRA